MRWSEIPSLAALRAFEASARHESFSEAAAELNVTHAAISQHVRRLEADLSLSLIERQGRGLVTTENGRLLAEHLLEGFTKIADGITILKDQERARPLSISLTPAFATNWLMPRMGDFWTKHPEISVNINPSTDVIDLARDGFDLAIRYGDGDWPASKSELLTGGDFWVAASPELLKGRRARCLQDVLDLPWFMESSMKERASLLHLNEVEVEKMDMTLMHTNGLVLSAALAGLGIIVQPISLIEREIASGALVKICALQQEKIGYYLVTLPDRHRSDLKVFMKWLRTQSKL
jgi:LysR family glycine cleavage system transcriptional activator